MRVFVTAALLIVLSILTNAQDKTDSNCPTVSVTGFAGIVAPGEMVTFTASVDPKGKELKLEYVWSVSSGTIVSGQGTSTIGVPQPNNSCVTVTVKIRGLPESCPSAASETSCFDPPILAVKLDEFVGSLAKVPAKRFVEAFNKAKDDSYAQVYIFISGARRYPKSSVRKKRQILMRHITVKCQFDTQRVTFVDVDNKHDDRVTIWLVPAGANLPHP